MERRRFEEARSMVRKRRQPSLCGAAQALGNWVAYCGIPQRRLSRESGLGEWTVGRVLRGESDLRFEDGAALAKRLHLPLHALAPESVEPTFISGMAHQNDDPSRSYVDHCRHAEHMLTIARTFVQGYLLHEGMFRHQVRRLALPEHLVEWHLRFSQYKKKQQPRTNYFHRIVVRQSFFDGAKPDWLECSRWWLRVFGQEEERLCMLAVPDGVFDEIGTAITHCLPAHLADWNEVSIVDDRIAFVNSGREQFNITYHEPTVKGLLGAATSLLTPLDAFPARERDIVNKVRQCNRLTRRFFDASLTGLYSKPRQR